MKRTPTGWVLILISWGVLFLGIIIGLFYLMYTEQRLLGFIALILGIVIFAVLRVLSNIGEFLFSIQLNSQNILLQESKHHDELSEKIKDVNSLLVNIQKKIEEGTSKITSFLSDIHSKIEEVSTGVNNHMFDLQHEIEDSLFQTNTILLNIQKKMGENFSRTVDYFSEVKNVIERSHQVIEQINCDSKDVNQNLYKLTSFLEEIEKNLDLKR